VNPLRAKWAAGEAAIGFWSGIPSPFAAELLARSGADYVCVDLQHGLADFSDLGPLLQAISSAGSTPLVRVAANEPWQIGKVLDQGALGVIVPLVETAEEAARAVAACRYPPNGIRSYGPSRAAGVLGSLDPAVLADEVVCFVMVETRRGLENVDAIARTPGLEGIYIGPNDLAVSLGVALRDPGTEHAAAVASIREACGACELVAGMHCTNGDAACDYIGQGFRLVTASADVGLLGRAAVRELERARTKAASV
jgi:4-hydroxy-2-oxoheptanedioate aldolase